MPTLGPPFDEYPAPGAPMPWDMVPTPDESPVPDLFATPPPPPPGYEEGFAGLTSAPDPFGREAPDIGAIAGKAAGAIGQSPPWFEQGEKVALGAPPADPMPREVDPDSPVVAEYNKQPGQVTPGRVFSQTVGYIDPLTGRPDPGDTETFAPEVDANPEGAAADRAWADSQAQDARIAAQADELDRLNPIERADVLGRRAAREVVERSRMELEQAEAEKARLEDDIRVRDEARTRAQADVAAVTAEAKAMADSSPFESWWADRSIPGKVAGFVGAIVAGLGNGNSGNNAFLDRMMKMADADAEQKWKKLETRRGLAQDALRDADADYRTREAMRIASRDQMARYIEQKLANLDPEGTAATVLHGARAKAGADMAAGLAALEKEQFERRLTEGKFAQEEKRIALEAIRVQETIDARMARERRMAMAAAASRSRPAGLLGKDSVYTAARWAEIIPEYKDVLARFDPRQPLSGADLDKLTTLVGTPIERTREKSVKQQTDIEKRSYEAEREVLWDGVPLMRTDENGKVVPVQAQSKEAGEEIRKRVANSKRALVLLNEAEAIRESASAWDLKFPGSPKRQALIAKAREIVNLTKQGMSGMSSDADMANIAESRGVEGITNWLSRQGAIEAGRANLQDGLNTELRERFKYNGEALIVENPYKAAKPAPDEDIAALNKRPADDGILSRRAWDPTYSRPGDLDVDAGAIEFRPDISAENRQGLAEIEARIALHNKGESAAADATVAAKGLVHTAVNGNSKAARLAASTSLWRMAKEGNPIAAEAIDKMSDDDRAQLLANLPIREAKRAFASMFPDVPDGD